MTLITPPPPAVRRHPRAFAIVLVLWVVGLVALILVALQTSAWRHAAEARRVVAQTRAHWAARAGVEAAIAQLAFNTLQPDTASATTITADLQAVASAQLDGASYDARTDAAPLPTPGPADAHAKININLMDAEALLLLPNMTEDIADAILDWIDDDDDPRELGAESAFYAQLAPPITPRNAPLRDVQELELVAGVRPELVRGEDWNLNARLDPNENDGAASWPPDDADNTLDAGWSEFLTAASVDATSASYGLSGEPRLDLTTADAQALQQRLDVDQDQAEAILAAAATPGTTLADFITESLEDLAPSNGARPADLSDAQLALLLDECVIPDPAGTDIPPGKLNVNTARDEVFEYVPGLDPAIADVLLYERQSRPQGFRSILDLLAVPSITRERLAELYPLLDVRSHAYTITVTGRDNATALEVTIIATLDRSTIPVRILSLRTR